MRLEDVIVPTTVENLSVLPSGILPSDAVGILNSQRMSDMIAELKTRYDIVFFDSPPMLGVSDASVLASEVDQTIIVVQHRRFPRAMLTRVKQAVLGVGGNVLGVVLNNVDLKHDQNYYYYTNYYGYYQPRDKEARRESRKATASTASNGYSDRRGILRCAESLRHSLDSLRRHSVGARPGNSPRRRSRRAADLAGVPNEEQQQVNNMYTVDATGAVNLPYINKVRAEGLTPAQLASVDRRQLSVRGDLHEPDDHGRDAADGALRERRRRGAHTVARSVHGRHDSADGDQRRRRLQ